MKSPVEIDFNIDKKSFEDFSFSKLPWRPFFGSLISVFVMVALQYLGIQLPNLWAKASLVISPLATKVEVIDPLRSLLDNKPNTYHLKKQSSFIQQANAASDYDTAHSYILVDYDSGKILADKDSDKEYSVASLTKIMTAIVALDLAKPTDTFTTSETAASIEPTRMGVKKGEQFSLKELIDGMLLFSANDAAEVIKEGIDAKYGHGTFVSAMNQKAAYIGLSHTHFANPQGFDNSNHYSSASDLAVLAHYALTNYPLIAQTVSIDQMVLPATATHHQFLLYNWNGLLDVYPGANGVKIGNTGDAEYTNIITAKRNGEQLLVVVLGAPGVLERDLWASELLDKGFSDTMSLPSVNVTEDQLRAKYATWQF